MRVVRSSLPCRNPSHYRRDYAEGYAEGWLASQILFETSNSYLVVQYCGLEDELVLLAECGLDQQFLETVIETTLKYLIGGRTRVYPSTFVPGEALPMINAQLAKERVNLT
jgi:hypothetical protein